MFCFTNQYIDDSLNIKNLTSISLSLAPNFVMKKIAKPAINEFALYYEKFVDMVSVESSVLDQLRDNALSFEKELLSKSNEQLSTPYAEGKWTIKDILMHLVDCERVFLYRAMRFARGDKSPLPFFDENEFALQANATSMPIKKILKEYRTIRKASIAFFSNQSSSVLKRTGTASNTPMSVRACAWVICGHEMHHWNVIRERYF